VGDVLAPKNTFPEWVTPSSAPTNPFSEAGPALEICPSPPKIHQFEIEISFLFLAILKILDSRQF